MRIWQRSSAEENFMAGPQFPIHKDTATNEDRFARRDVRRYSGWSSAAVITATVIIVGIVFFYLAMHSGFQSNHTMSTSAPVLAPAH